MRTVALRRVFRIVNGGTPTSGESNWGGDVQWATPIDLARHNGRRIERTDRTLTPEGLSSGSRMVGAGGLIVSTRAPIGYVAETAAPMAFNQGCRGLEPRLEVDIRYFRYQLGSMSEQLRSRGQGSTFAELSSDALAESHVALPPIGEQRAIADYLDAETARIDSLIAKKQQLIHLLEERWSATIDSVIDELLDVRVSLRRFVRLITQGVSPQAGNVPYSPGWRGLLKLSAVRSGEYRPAENKELDADFDFSRAVVPGQGDLLVTRANTPELVGDACAVRDPDPNVVLCDLIYLLRLDGRLTAEFAAYVLIGKRSRCELSSLARGTSQSMVKLRGEDVLSVRIPALAPRDQAEVVRRLDSKRNQVSGATDLLLHQLELLAEHRKALITAAVTGEVTMPAVA